MNTLTVDLPPDISPERARLLLAIQLFEDQEVSLGYAARMAEHSIGAFVDVLGRRGVPVIAYPPGDLEAEMEVFERLDSSKG